MNIWFALVEVRELPGFDLLDGALGAFVNVAYRAVSEKDLIVKLQDSFLEEGFTIFEVDDVEPLENITADYWENAEKLDLLRDVLEGELAYAWGVFHTYSAE